MRTVKLTKESTKDILENLLKRSPNNYGKFESTVAQILDKVKNEGDAALFAGNGGSGPAPEELLPGSVLARIVVPKKITVHLGKPSANVRNVTVSFQSYIANVASSEVYPTWDSAPGTRRTSI